MLIYYIYYFLDSEEITRI